MRQVIDFKRFFATFRNLFATSEYAADSGSNSLKNSSTPNLLIPKALLTAARFYAIFYLTRE